MSDDEIALLNRGGHDSQKVWNAYAAAVAHKGRPTVILAKTVKGYGMGKAGEALNVTHQQKKLDDEALKAFRDRFNIPVTDEEIARLPFFRPAEDSAEMQYLKARRKALGGSLPVRRTQSRRRSSCRRSKPSRACSTAARGARSRPRWCSCGS